MAYYATYMPNELGELQKVVINAGVGFVLPYYGETAPPGTLACDGSEVSREAYSELFAVLGTKAGAGDGSTTFNVPDLRGRWIVGADAEQAAGEEVAEGLPNITGGFFIRDCFYGNGRNTNIVAVEGGICYTSASSPQQPFSDILSVVDGGGISNGTLLQMDASRASSIYGAQSHVTPASVALLWCIIYE